MATGPDLFVVCKTCGSEVSPYITECPYCGTRLRKRAPKIERDGTVSERRTRRGSRRRGRSPAAAPRIPGIAPGVYGAKPWATVVLIALSCFMWITLAWVPLGDLVIVTTLSEQPLRLISSVFVYGNGWYEFAVLIAIGIYGWRLELRHGLWVVLALFIAGGVGGLAVAAAADDVPAFGANGAALALLSAWAMRDALVARAGGDYDGDLLGTAVISAVVFLMPAVVPEASWVAGGVGILVGALAGTMLARLPET
ncbi:MAG TPA: rhomboid family intramembrane serine protease [Solirubrobacteraceae bacterium]|nr:rhomboid family intramembrane serine protease [Solirubrobacteraceae bacterium]